MDSYNVAVCIVTLLITCNLFTITDAWRNRDVEKKDRSSNKIERRIFHELDRLNKKIDTIVDKLNITVDWAEELDPKWPPILLLNASVVKIEGGTSLKFWYKTYSQCTDIKPIWKVLDRVVYYDYLTKTGDDYCSCNSVSCLGYTSLVVEEKYSVKLEELLLVDQKTYFSYRVMFNGNLSYRVYKEIVCESFFYVRTPKEVVYKTKEDAVFNVVYFNRNRKSANDRQLYQKMMYFHDIDSLNKGQKSRPHRVYINEPIDTNLHVFNEINFLNNSTFDYHVKTTQFKPVGLGELQTLCTTYGSDGPISIITVKQEIPIHETSQKQAYPEGFLHWESLNMPDQDSLNFPCIQTTDNSPCVVRCEVEGNNIHDLVLKQFDTDERRYKEMLPKSLMTTKYYAKGVWFVEQPGALLTIMNFTCVVRHENNKVASTDISIPYVLAPVIQIEKSYVHFDTDNNTLNVVCVSTGNPRPELYLGIYGNEYEHCDSEYIKQNLKIESDANHVIGRLEDFDFQNCRNSKVSNITVICYASALKYFVYAEAVIGETVTNENVWLDKTGMNSNHSSDDTY